MSATGLFLEGDLKQDYPGIFSFIVLSLILTPYQAYASLKGLFEYEEGSWIRTLKTGNVTDKVVSLKIRSPFNLKLFFQYLHSVFFSESDSGGY